MRRITSFPATMVRESVMRVIAAAAALACVLAVGTFAFAGTPSSRPSGVRASDWIQLGPTSGFVITNEGRSGPGGVSGYLMAQKDGTWVRLDVLNSAQLFNGH